MSARDFLVEIGTEELPPGALAGLGGSFCRNIEEGLNQRALAFGVARWFATPRRLAVLIEQLAEKAPDEQAEIHGPPAEIAYDKDGEPTKAAVAFAAKNNVSLDALFTLDTDKGRRIACRVVHRGEIAVDCLASIVRNALHALPIPKRMRWGAASDEFVRPVHWLVLLFGEEVIDAEILGVVSGRSSRGHRVHAPGEVALGRPADYESALRQAFVNADFYERKGIVKSLVDAQARNANATTDNDDALLEEVTALVEWPVALTGSFDESFLEVPAEALVSSMKEHQKYFPLYDDSGALLPKFVFVANVESSAPDKIVDGNQRVIRPRLADARFFYRTDRKTPLASRCNALKGIVFEERLGTLWDKTERSQKLARAIAKEIGSNVDFAARAAELAKADLVTEMVLEFDKMQGIAGSYYARHDGEVEEVAEAIAEHYLPRFAGDVLPQTNCGTAVALADRIDTLVGIFGIGEPPTGSRDPFALRRAALGVIRIITEHELHTLDLNDLLWEAKTAYGDRLSNHTVVDDVSDFIFDRYRAIYNDEGVSTNTVVAVQNVMRGNRRQVHNPYDVSLRIRAVERFRRLAEADALISANKRVQNILAKQAGDIEDNPVRPEFLVEPAERALNEALTHLAAEVPGLCDNRDYTEALFRLATLKEPIDAFFDHVMVMTDDPVLRGNRVNVLRRLHSLFFRIADISQLQA